MKNLIYLTTFLCAGLATAQVAIGKNAVSNASVSLEFAEEPKGIILPWVTAAADVTQVVNGTLILDTADKKIKAKLASGWKDLTVYEINNAIDTSLQTNPLKPEFANAKVSIETPTNTAGILVLEDTNKAMVLPIVENPWQTIKNPAPGMMAYDSQTQQLAVFNGTVWTFWKPQQ